MNRRACGIAVAAAVVAAIVGAWDTGRADQPAQLEPWADARLPVTAGASRFGSGQPRLLRSELLIQLPHRCFVMSIDRRRFRNRLPVHSSG